VIVIEHLGVNYTTMAESAGYQGHRSFKQRRPLG